MNIIVNGETRTYADETTLLEISRDVAANWEYPVIVASVNGTLRELTKTVQDGANVELLTTATDAGNKTYIRGLILLFLRAVYTVFGGKDVIDKVRIEHSIGNGLYGEIDGNVEINEENMQLVKQEMQRLVAADLPITKNVINTSEAAERFHRHHMYDKEKLFGYRRTSKANVYNLDGFEDYFYGYMPSSTGVLTVFDVFAYENGFLLLTPDKERPNELAKFESRDKFFRVLQESNEWAGIMEIETVGAMNDALVSGNLNEIILVQEAFMEKKIAEMAEQIKERGNVKFVMIAGPSSSGKTTFSHRLSIQLKTLGMKPHPIGVDDYFLNREDTPKHPDGTYDFEALEAIDVEQFK